MRPIEVLNKIAPDYFDRFRFNTTKDAMYSALTTEHDLTQTEVTNAISMLDLLVHQCYEALKTMIQARMSMLSAPEEKAEPDLDLLIDRTFQGVDSEAKQRIKHYAGWLVAKG